MLFFKRFWMISKILFRRKQVAIPMLLLLLVTLFLRKYAIFTRVLDFQSNFRALFVILNAFSCK